MAAHFPANRVYQADAARHVRVLMIASRDLFVDGIIRILESAEESMRVTCVSPGEPCARHFAGQCPDLLLLQENSKPEPFEDFLSEMVEGFPAMRVLVFGQGMPDDYLFRVINAGAHGYINDKMKGEHMLDAVAAVRSGHFWVERHIMERFIAENSVIDGIQTKIRSLGTRLTTRESEVLSLVMLGMSTSEIAERVFLSHQGVKAHLTSLFRKFNVKNRPQLILSVMDEVSPVESISGLVQQGLQSNRLAG